MLELHNTTNFLFCHPQQDEKSCTEDKLRKCGCQKHACTSATCEVKVETLSPTEKLSVASSPGSKFNDFKLENNNVKCESCSLELGGGLPCVANCNVKCESDYKCDIMNCEQCMKEGGMTLEVDKDSGIDEKLDSDPNVKEEVDVMVIDNENWKKPDYEPTVQETVDDKEKDEKNTKASIPEAEVEEQPRCQKVTKRKLSLDSLSDSRKKRKGSKRALSVGSSQDNADNEQSTKIDVSIEPISSKIDCARAETNAPKKKQAKKDAQKRKAEAPSACEIATKKAKKQIAINNVGNCSKPTASDTSIMETIDDVIQQSLQMTQRKERKPKNCERVEKRKKSDEVPSAVKKNVKKTEPMKEVATEKPSKVTPKSGQSKGKADAKPKTKDSKSKSKGKGKVVETKAQETKSRIQDAKARDGSKKREAPASKTKARDVSPDDPKKSVAIKRKRKNPKKKSVKKSGCKVEDSTAGNESPTKLFQKPKWSNGWSWEGEPYEAKVYLTVRIIAPFLKSFSRTLSFRTLRYHS